jgi:predicted DNA-binding transcriptional regulator AlpA
MSQTEPGAGTAASAKVKDELLTLEQVSAVVKVGKTKLYEMMAAGQFVRPVLVSPTLKRWRASQVNAWLEQLPEAAQAPAGQQ